MEDVSNTVKDVEKKEEPKVEDELVSRKVLDVYKNDMHKYKTRMKETEVELQELRDAKVLQEKQVLEEKEEWQILYEREKTEKVKMKEELDTKSSLFIDTSKKNAVIQKLGGFKKSDYAKFIDTGKIDVLENGVISEESIDREVDRIKQDYPELLLGKPTGKMPNESPQNMGYTQNRSLNSLSSQELLDLYSKVKN